MAWWQKKILRYALSRTGFLDDKALDLDKLDIALGKKNVVELKDVGLNIKKISKLAQLPPGLRVETARVLTLRLTVPADIYQSSIIAEIDGVELSLRLEESKDVHPPKERKSRARSPVVPWSPQHRKMHRRLHSPPPFDPGGLSDSEELRIPTVDDLAKSFLQDEPVQERRELEASVAANTKAIDESIVSESSEGDDFGTGAAIGLPGFLAGFLQGIVDRLQVKVKNVEARLEAEVAGDNQQGVPVTLRLQVGNAELENLCSNTGDQDPGQESTEPRRRVNLQDIALNLLSDSAIFSELSELPSHESPGESRRDPSSPLLRSSGSAKTPAMQDPSRIPGSGSGRAPSSANSPTAMRASILTEDEDRFADAGDEDVPRSLEASHLDLDIQPGDDNISWGSRRNKSNATVEDLWNSMASEDDLPDSLLLDRAPTPQAQSTQNPNPTITRTQHDISPYARTLQSPGSWPRIDESPQCHRFHQSPGSWPTLDQSQQGMFQSMTAESELPAIDSVDNKRSAMEASVADAGPLDLPAPLTNAPVEDLTVSRIFSHEEAESMYMSAMTYSPEMHVPGGWSEGEPSESPSSQDESQGPIPEPLFTGSKARKDFDEDLAYGDQPYSTPIAPRSGNVTPRARSPEPVSAARQNKQKASRQLLFVNTLSLLLPNVRSTANQDNHPVPATSGSMSFAPQGIPGTFSAYSEMTLSRRKLPSFSRDGDGSVAWSTPETYRSNEDSTPLRLEVGAIKCEIDIPSGRLLYMLTTNALAALQPFDGGANTQQRQSAHGNAKTTPVSMSIENVTVALNDSADVPSRGDHNNGSTSDSLIALQCGNIDFSSSAEQTSLYIGALRTFLGSSCFLSFDRSHDMKSSMLISENAPDVAFVVSTRTTPTKRTVTDVSIETLPINVFINLPIIDDAFGSLGGLSGVLERSNSILSESGLASSSPSPSKVVKGVRFEGENQHLSTEPELKINARVGALEVLLQGDTSHLRLRTTTVKAVYREQGAVMTISQVLVSGPYAAQDSSAPLLVDLSALRVEYLVSPQDKDIERLLSLLTPSKDRYDNDDDILIDTLIRQRKKGALARASIASVKVCCDDWSCISTLSTLAGEMAKLSAVAKYLPEDERPGLLTLLRVKEFEAGLPVNDRFGSLRLDVSDFHCAHVGLPALLALSLGHISATDAQNVALLHSLLQPAMSENLPVMMARMLGDEVEPTVKVKLYNICVEYSVPTIVALTGLGKEADSEEVIAELTKSVANIVLHHDRGDQQLARQASDVSDLASKRMNVNLLIHDSAVGLNPQNLPSKALLVLTDALCSSTIPPEDTLTAKVELRKAGLFIADHFTPNSTEETSPPRIVPNNSATKARLTTALSRQGFVSVGSMMKASVAVRVERTTQSDANSVNVDVRNELLLLETCADSTQTLIATLNGLTPPTPPSKQPKYQTEPMTIEDMMASFTGDAFAKPDQTATTLFDVEEDSPGEPELMMDIPALDTDDDGPLAESDMTSSLYGPIGSMLGDVDKPLEDDSSEDYAATAESLLEDDPFEMPNSPTDAPLSDSALVRELNKQCKQSSGENAVDLGLYEIEDLGFDALGANQRALGTQYRFNTPTTTRHTLSGWGKHVVIPINLKLRDLHIIWNIYDGYDWQRTRNGITEAVEQVENRIEQRKAKKRQSRDDREEEESVIGDFLFNSIYIGVPSNHDAQELRRQINRNIDDMASETESVPMSGMSRPTTYSASGRPLKQRQRRRLKLERSKSHKIAFELKGVSVDVLVFPPESADIVSSVDVRVKEFEIFDNVPTSTWKKFLTHLDNDPSAREMSKPMMHIELLNVRTLENFAASEIVLHVSVLPLRLHVDQDALDFITRFFEFKDDGLVPPSSASEQPFIQRIEVDTVDMRLDYKPKKVDYAGIRSGHTTEFMNFVILDAADIRLKHAIVYGIKGFEPLHQTLNDVWMPDIKRNQLPTILGGLAPVRSLVNIGAGVRDVIAIPVREYRKDGRIVRSIQKGAYHFGKTTASELARLGAKVAIGTQTLLQGAEGFLSPASTSPSGRPSSGRRLSSDQGWQDVASDDDERETRAISAYANQPLGVLSGLRSARRFLEHDLLTARDALIAVQGEVLESSSPGSAAAAVVRHAPIVILRPIIGTSRAVGTALLGVGNQIDRENIRRIDDKYKRR